MDKVYGLFPEFGFGDTDDKEDCFGNGLWASSA